MSENKWTPEPFPEHPLIGSMTGKTAYIGFRNPAEKINPIVMQIRMPHTSKGQMEHDVSVILHRVNALSGIPDPAEYRRRADAAIALVEHIMMSDATEYKPKPDAREQYSGVRGWIAMKDALFAAYRALRSKGTP